MGKEPVLEPDSKTKLDWSDIADRALWTALEAGVALISTAVIADVVANQPVIIESGVWWAALATGLAAGVAMIKSIVVQKRNNGN